MNHYIEQANCHVGDIILSYSRRRTPLNGKVVNLRQKICDILDIPLAYINSSRYIRSDRCYRDIKRLEKIREDSNSLHVSLKDRFVSTNRLKGGVPSDACISPIATAPPKLHRPCTKPDSRISKSLQFGKEPLIIPRPIDGPPRLRPF